MTNDIFCVGLTRTELQTLGVLLPITFRIIPVSSEALDHAAVVRVIDQARCIILNPKRLSVDLLDDFLRGQDYQRWNNAPVPIILFSDTMTKEQRHEVFMPEYPILSVDLHERFDRNRNLAVKLLRESALPCWQNRKVMRSNTAFDHHLSFGADGASNYGYFVRTFFYRKNQSQLPHVPQSLISRIPRPHGAHSP